MNMFRAEWKKVFSNRLLILMMIFIPLVPTIYAGIIISAYWDPFGNTSKLPVAVVNLDEPYDWNGKTLKIGDELINHLKENENLNWDFVSLDEAKQGFNKGKYFMVITIPNDFSKKASTVLEDQPEKMNLTYEVNPGRNFFSVIIGEQAMDRIIQTISENITKEYVKAVFSQMNKIGKGFADASGGALQIHDGAEQLSEGNQKLTKNLNKLAASSLTFKNGINTIDAAVGDFIGGADELHHGAVRLHKGIHQYTDGIRQLKEKTAPLADKQDGVGKLAAGQQQLHDALHDLAAGSRELNSGLTQLYEQLPSHDEINQLVQGLVRIQQALNQLQTLINESNAPQELVSRANALYDNANQMLSAYIRAISGYSEIRNAFEGEKGIIQGSEKLANGMNQAFHGSRELVAATSHLTDQLLLLVDAVNQIHSNSEHLQSGAAKLADGTDALASRLPQLGNGVKKLSEGAAQLNAGAEQLANGSAQLGEGLSAIKKGADELARKLSEGADSVAGVQPQDGNYDMFASPIALEEVKTTEVPNYGHALAPMFFSIGLFAGALAFTIFFPLSETAMKPTSGLAWWFSKFSLGLVPAVAGALILDVVSLFVLDLEVNNVGQFIFISLLGSVTYMFFMMLLVITFGNAGRFLAMVFFVLQFSSSGGMFPVVLQNDFFQSINPYMPMTYVIYGYREAMTSSLGSEQFIISAAVLAGFLIVFNLLLYIFLTIKFKLQDSDKGKQMGSLV